MATKTNQPNREELLQLAETSAKQGNKDGARLLFRQVLSQDKRNERAIMWMARLAKNKKERKQWLQRALNLNPDNEIARQQLEKINYRQAAKENRTLLIFGTLAAVLIIVAVLVVIVVLALNG